MQDCYREAASLLLVRPVNDGDWSTFEVLLLHKPRKKDAWQLPQGGKEGKETAEQCAIRELKEEAGISHVTVLGVSDQEYKYDFPKSFRRFRPDHICGQEIAFVIGTTDREASVTVDGVEVDDFRWLAPEALATYVQRSEYMMLVDHLIAEAKELLKNQSNV